MLRWDEEKRTLKLDKQTGLSGKCAFDIDGGGGGSGDGGGDVPKHIRTHNTGQNEHQTE